MRVVVIPFKNEREMTDDLVNELLDQGEVDRILLLDNGSKPSVARYFEGLAAIDPTLRNIDAGGLGIYAMWNLGLMLAGQEAGAEDFDVAILNNDISIPQAFLSTMSSALRSSPEAGAVYPNYNRRVESGVENNGLSTTTGTYQFGGMCGWAFMVKGELWRDHKIPYVDESYEWWYGDDDLEEKVRDSGYSVMRINGLPVDHISEATARNGENNWIHEAKVRDAERWRKRRS